MNLGDTGPISSSGVTPKHATCCIESKIVAWVSVSSTCGCATRDFQQLVMESTYDTQASRPGQRKSKKMTSVSSCSCGLPAGWYGRHDLLHLAAGKELSSGFVATEMTYRRITDRRSPAILAVIGQCYLLQLWASPPGVCRIPIISNAPV